VTANQKVCKISEKCFYCDGYGVRPRKSKLESGHMLEEVTSDVEKDNNNTKFFKL
jgi:hypothetical protein